MIVGVEVQFSHGYISVGNAEVGVKLFVNSVFSSAQFSDRLTARSYYISVRLYVCSTY